MIFKPFTQADDFTTRRYGGTGLGLAIARAARAAHGRRLSVESRPGEGSRFTFTARSGPVLRSGRLDRRRCEPSVFRSARPRRVLLVEDHPMNQEVATGLLECWGHAVTRHQRAGGAGRARQPFLRPCPDGRSDADHGRPGDHGRDQAAGGGSGSRTPIVALTAHGTAADRERCLAAGMDDFVSKPLDARALFQVIERVGSSSSAAPPSAGEVLPADPALEARLDPASLPSTHRVCWRPRATRSTARTPPPPPLPPTP